MQTQILNSSSEAGVTGPAPGLACMGAANRVDECNVLCGRKVKIGKGFDDGGLEALRFDEILEFLLKERSFTRDFPVRQPW